MALPCTPTNAMALSMQNSVKTAFNNLGFTVTRNRAARFSNGLSYPASTVQYKILDDDTRKIFVHGFVDSINMSSENQDIQNLLAPHDSDITEGDQLIYNGLIHRVVKAFKPQTFGDVVIYYQIQVIREDKA